MSRIRDRINGVLNAHGRVDIPRFDRRYEKGVEHCGCAWEGPSHAEHVTGLLDTLVSQEYEFACPSFVYAGPGHQSRHTCEYNHPHPIEGEHSDSMYEWEGTAVMTEEDGRKRLLFNPRHHGGFCC